MVKIPLATVDSEHPLDAVDYGVPVVYATGVTSSTSTWAVRKAPWVCRLAPWVTEVAELEGWVGSLSTHHTFFFPSREESEVQMADVQNTLVT